MEGVLRLILLFIAAGIVFLILSEPRYRRRQDKIAKAAEDSFKSDIIFNPDEILGFAPREPVERREPQRVAVKQMELPGIPGGLPPSSPVTDVKRQQKGYTNDLLVISVIAKANRTFGAYDLLQSISATGMQFGDMNIFHYNAQTERGRMTLFSLVSSTEPGEFDLDRIGDFTCTGLTLFTNMAQLDDPEEVFDLMLITAQQLAEDLDGELRAGMRTPWSDDALQAYFYKISQFKAMKYA